MDDQTTPDKTSGPAVQPLSSAPLTRVCSRCSVQSQVPGNFCPSCGKAYARRKGPSKKVVVIAAILSTLIIGGRMSVYFVKQHNDRLAADKREAASAQAERRAEKDAADKAAAQQEADEAKESRGES